MNSDKLVKQIWTALVVLLVCVVINFVFVFSKSGGTDPQMRKDLDEAYSKISVLEREIAYLTEQAESGSVDGGKSIAYELLEGRVAILERNGVGSDASIEQRLKQLEMMVSTLEIAFKQANNISTANTGNNRPATTTTTTTTTNRSNTTTSGNKQPIQIQTGSSTTPSANAKYHTVQAGENLFRISQKYGLTVEQLRRMNNMKESDVLKAGQRLIVSQ